MADEAIAWNERYRSGETPWDTNAPSPELERVIRADGIMPCRALEIGCGTGTNAVWLAQQAFDVTAMDLAPLAIEQARSRAAQAGVHVRFCAGDITRPPDLGAPFAFVFDRGCYHAVRRSNASGYLAGLQQVAAPGARVLILAGNAREPHDPGPPVVSEADIRAELGKIMTIERLREFRFAPKAGSGDNFLAWSILLRNAG